MTEEEKLPGESSFSGFEDTTSFSWQRSRLYNEQDFMLDEFLEDNKTMYGVFAIFSLTNSMLLLHNYSSKTSQQSRHALANFTLSFEVVCKLFYSAS